VARMLSGLFVCVWSVSDGVSTRSNKWRQCSNASVNNHERSTTNDFTCSATNVSTNTSWPTFSPSICPGMCELFRMFNAMLLQLMVYVCVAVSICFQAEPIMISNNNKWKWRMKTKQSAGGM